MSATTSSANTRRGWPCECPARGVPAHEGACPYPADRTVNRRGVRLRLCTQCYFRTDEDVDLDRE